MDRIQVMNNTIYSGDTFEHNGDEGIDLGMEVRMRKGSMFLSDVLADTLTYPDFAQRLAMLLQTMDPRTDNDC